MTDKQMFDMAYDDCRKYLPGTRPKVLKEMANRFVNTFSYPVVQVMTLAQFYHRCQEFDEVLEELDG